MLKIEINDPHLMPTEVLAKTAAFLLSMRGYEGHEVMTPEVIEPMKLKKVTQKKLKAVKTESTPEPAEPELESIKAQEPVNLPGFADLMGLITKSITEGVLKREQVIEILKPYGIVSLPLVATRLDLIPFIMESVNEVINAPR